MFLFLALAALLAVVALAACGGSPEAPPAGAANGASGPAPDAAGSPPSAESPGADSSVPAVPAPASTLSASAIEAAQSALTAYEAAREDLANDKSDGLAKAAEEIEAGAKKAGEGAPENLKPSFDRLGAASAKLKADAGKKIDNARMTFGEVSEAMVALLSLEPVLAQGRYVFECPMTDTYKKWVQVDDQIKNPYMGSRMLGCGVTSTWEP
jgi:hypothetical protein